MLEDHSACPCSIGSTSLSPYDSAGDLDSLFRSLTMAEVADAPSVLNPFFKGREHALRGGQHVQPRE